MKKHLYLIGSALLVILMLLVGCLQEESLHRPFSTFAPVDIADGWVISTPTAEGIDSLGLVSVYRDLYRHRKAWNIKSMLVFRHGKLVAESYLKDDYDRIRYNTLWSCTKQVTALSFGIALEEGLINSVGDSLKTYLQDELTGHADKQNITLENLLTMRMGIFFDNGYMTDTFRMHSVTSSVDYILDQELRWAPGTHYMYNDGSPQLISAVMQNATGQTLAAYTKTKLFDRIGFSSYTWEQYSDGITMGPWGLAMPPRELAKIAQCVCNNGMWNGEQVIPQSWLSQMLQERITETGSELGFGYFWWLNPDENVYAMRGHGGQYAVIYPDKELVVIFTGLENTEDEVSLTIEEAMVFTDRIKDLIED